VSTRPCQTTKLQVKDNDQIWYEFYEALQTANASESLLEVLRTLVLERSTDYVPCVDSTPIVVTPSATTGFPHDTYNLAEISSTETRYSVHSSNSSTSTDSKKRGSLSAVLKSRKSKFIDAAMNADMDKLLELRTQVDKSIIQRALLELVQSEDVQIGQAEVVRLLLTWGAHVEYPDSFYRRTPLILAIIAHRLDFVNLLIEAGARLEARDGTQHKTPLIWAIYQDDSTTLRQLIQKGANINVTDRKTKHSPLVLATHLSHLATARTLLEENAQLIDEKDQDGLTPLAIAYTKCHIPLAELFLQYKDDKDFIWPSGLSLLAMAVAENRIDFMRLLIDNGASLAHVGNAPALTVAVKQQDLSTVQFLLNQITKVDRALLEARDTKGGTALLWAVWQKNERIVEMLVAAGASTSVKDGENLTIQQWAQWTKNQRIVALVMQNGRNGYGRVTELPG
jgi:ankyrin repeat protein